MKIATIVMAAALVGIPATVAANHPDGFGMPPQSFFGLCTAYENNEKGRENGNAGNASPFHWMADQAEAANQTVEQWCDENAQHPGQGNGPPENPGNGNGNGNGKGNGNSDQARGD